MSLQYCEHSLFFPTQINSSHFTVAFIVIQVVVVALSANGFTLRSFDYSYPILKDPKHSFRQVVILDFFPYCYLQSKFTETPGKNVKKYNLVGVKSNVFKLRKVFQNLGISLQWNQLLHLNQNYTSFKSIFLQWNLVSEDLYTRTVWREKRGT